MRGIRYEVSTSGFDPALQGVWSDPYGGAYNVGLMVPQVLPVVRDPQHRLLFMLAFARFGAHRKARLVGVRQLLTIAALIPQPSAEIPPPPYIFEQQVKTPYWHFTDADVSWHVMRVPPGNQPLPNKANADGIAFRYATGAALLFEKNPNGVSYAPPNGGRPLGAPISSSLGNLHDIRYPWNSDHAQDSLDIEIEGPCDLVFYASVQQTNPATRPSISSAGLTFPFGTGCLPKEEAFIGNFENQTTPVPVTYWRIGGSMIIEENSMIPWPRGLIEDDPMPWIAPTKRRGALTEGSLIPAPRGPSLEGIKPSKEIPAEARLYKAPGTRGKR
jgi:hypothetical protein